MGFGNFGDESKPNIGSDFTINQYENASANYQTRSTANDISAVATIEVKVDPPPIPTIITITSTAGVTKTYAIVTADSSADTGEISEGHVIVQIETVTGVGNIAAEIQTAINSANGHNGGSANSVISISRTDGVLTLTQVVAGEDGNKEVGCTATPSNILATSFDGGSDGSLDQIPFSLGLSGILPFNIGSVASRSAYTMTKGKQISTE